MKTLLQIEPAYRVALTAAGLKDFDAFMRVRGGSPVGWHRHRETLPLDLEVAGQARRFFLKRVFWVPPKHSFWPLFRGQLGHSQPYHEWHMLIELERAGIPAMRRVACGERRRFGLPTQAFLLVEAVPMPYTLENWLLPGFPQPPPIEEKLRDQLLLELSGLIRQLQAAGLDWPDLRAKHIFAAPANRPTNEPGWDFCLIDVERMKKGKLSPAHLKNFRTEMELMQAGSSLPLREWEKCSLFPTEEARLPLPEDYRHPGACEFVKHNGITAEKSWNTLLAKAGLVSLEAVFHYGAGQYLGKPGLAAYRDRVRLELPDDKGQSKVLYLKRYRRPPWREQWRRIAEWRAKRSTAAREVHYINKLLSLGISAPPIVAYGEQMNGRLEQRSFLILDEIRGQSLEKLAEGLLRGSIAPCSWLDRREIIRQLALIARRLHENRYYHRDLYLSHVFLTRNLDGRIVLHLIDLARMISRPWLAERWRIKDLAALDYSSPGPLVTRADRLRFLYHYCGFKRPWRSFKGGAEGARSAIELRRLMAKIRKKVQRMARHEIHRQARFNGRDQA